jgi:hypothetical protein
MAQSRTSRVLRLLWWHIGELIWGTMARCEQDAGRRWSDLREEGPLREAPRLHVSMSCGPLRAGADHERSTESSRARSLAQIAILQHAPVFFMIPLLDRPRGPAEGPACEHRQLSVCTPLHMHSCMRRRVLPTSHGPSTRPGYHTSLRATDCAQLETLPDELLQLIVHYLPIAALKNAALASSTLNRHATDVLWQHVCLVDQWTLHPCDDPEPIIEDIRGTGHSDEHDDTPIIRKLFIFATCARHSFQMLHRLTSPGILA